MRVKIGKLKEPFALILTFALVVAIAFNNNAIVLASTVDQSGVSGECCHEDHEAQRAVEHEAWLTQRGVHRGVSRDTPSESWEVFSPEGFIERVYVPADAFVAPDLFVPFDMFDFDVVDLRHSGPANSERSRTTRSEVKLVGEAFGYVIYLR